MWRNVSTWQILLHISPHDMIVLFIYHVETYLQLNICHVEKLLHMTICHMEKILHMTDFSPQAPLVVFVTNIRYDYMYWLLWARMWSPVVALYFTHLLGRSFELAWLWGLQACYYCNSSICIQNMQWKPIFIKMLWLTNDVDDIVHCVGTFDIEFEF